MVPLLYLRAALPCPWGSPGSGGVRAAGLRVKTPVWVCNWRPWRRQREELPLEGGRTQGKMFTCSASSLIIERGNSLSWERGRIFLNALYKVTHSPWKTLLSFPKSGVLG